MNRYMYTLQFDNSDSYYSYLRRTRNLLNVRHYETPVLKNPSVGERMYVTSDTHIWKYGDRFYNLAHKYYGDPTYWWVIAWYNALPTEADIRIGDVIQIPISLEEAHSALGV